MEKDNSELKKVIINADDFGLTKKVSDAIIEIYQKGNLSSTTLMVNMPGTDYAIQLAKDNPDLGIGLHFNVTEGTSMVGKSSLTDENNTFSGKMPLNKKLSLGKVNLDDLKLELKSQYEYLEKSGIKITHIDSHQHTHMNPKVFPLVADFAKSKNVAIRIAFPQVLKRSNGSFNLTKRIKQFVLNYAARKNAKYAKKIGVKYNFSFNSIFDFHPFKMPVSEDYLKLIEESNSNSHELMVHPYILSEELKSLYGNKYQAKTEFFEKAVKEYDSLKDLKLTNEIKLVKFSHL